MAVSWIKKLRDVNLGHVLDAMGLNPNDLESALLMGAASQPFDKGGKVRQPLNDGQQDAIIGRWFQGGNANGVVDVVRGVINDSATPPVATV